MKLSGSCHCAAIRYELDWPDQSSPIPARKCGCSYCTRFDGTWTAHPGASLVISSTKVAGPGRYRFGTETADFLFCRKCGVTVAAVCDLAGEHKAVVNIATLENVQSLVFDHTESNFDNESKEQRLERRNARWIGRVSLLSIG